MLDYAIAAMENSNQRLSGPVRSSLKELLAGHRHQDLLNRWVAEHPEQAPGLLAKIR